MEVRLVLGTLKRVLSFMGERRKDGRDQARLPAEFLVWSAEGQAWLVEPQPAVVVSLSASGCCLAVASLNLDRFHLTRCLESPEDYPLEVILDGPQGQVWRVRGWVRWTNRVGEDDPLPFRVGVQWTAVGLPDGWRGLLRLPNP